MLRHDFRPTAGRNMGNGGVPKSIAIKGSEYKMPNDFDRLLIVTPSDLLNVARKLRGTFSGILGQVELDVHCVSL